MGRVAVYVGAQLKVAAGMPGTMLSSVTKGVTRSVPLGSHDNTGRISQVGSRDFLDEDLWPAPIGCREHPHSRPDPNGPFRGHGTLIAYEMFARHPPTIGATRQGCFELPSSGLPAEHSLVRRSR